jgi:hypothetical protein
MFPGRLPAYAPAGQDHCRSGPVHAEQYRVSDVTHPWQPAIGHHQALIFGPEHLLVTTEPDPL